MNLAQNLVDTASAGGERVALRYAFPGIAETAVIGLKYTMLE